jgi:predicted transcriptional regulator of viral defense system
MEIDELVYRMGGIAEWRRPVADFPAAQVRTAVARGRLVRIGHGRYALPHVTSDVVAARSLNGVLSLTSAALHHGWAVKTPPKTPYVTVPRHRKMPPSRRRGAQLRFVDVEADGS